MPSRDAPDIVDQEPEARVVATALRHRLPAKAYFAATGGEVEKLRKFSHVTALYISIHDPSKGSWFCRQGSPSCFAHTSVDDGIDAFNALTMSSRSENY